MSNSTNGEASLEVPVPKAVTYSSVKPKLFVEAPKTSDAVQFFKAAFGAEEVRRDVQTKRKAEQEQPLLLSVELRIGDFSFLVADLTDDVPELVKTEVKGSVMCLETVDVEAAVAKAVAAGGVSETCGEGVGKLKDPFGNLWIISSPIKITSDGVEARILL